MQDCVLCLLVAVMMAHALHLLVCLDVFGLIMHATTIAEAL